MEKVVKNIVDLNNAWENSEMTIVMRAWESLDKLILISKVYGSEHTNKENTRDHKGSDAARST